MTLTIIFSSRALSALLIISVQRIMLLQSIVYMICSTLAPHQLPDASVYDLDFLEVPA
jgi:hypothetical protein